MRLLVYFVFIAWCNIQCGTVITRSIFAQIVKINTPKLVCEDEVWGVCCKIKSYLFSIAVIVVSCVILWYIRSHFCGTQQSIISKILSLAQSFHKKIMHNKNPCHSCFAICHTSGPFYWRGLTLILERISNYIHYKVWDEITYPFINFNGCSVEV